MAIRFFDMFAGIGGFRSGVEAVGGYQCAGHCEIDKYANQAYNAIYESKGELYFEDARTIAPEALPDIDLICAGFCANELLNQTVLAQQTDLFDSNLIRMKIREPEETIEQNIGM